MIELEEGIVLLRGFLKTSLGVSPAYDNTLFLFAFTLPQPIHSSYPFRLLDGRLSPINNKDILFPLSDDCIQCIIIARLTVLYLFLLFYCIVLFLTESEEEPTEFSNGLTRSHELALVKPHHHPTTDSDMIPGYCTVLCRTCML